MPEADGSTFFLSSPKSRRRGAEAPATADLSNSLVAEGFLRRKWFRFGNPARRPKNSNCENSGVGPSPSAGGSSCNNITTAVRLPGFPAATAEFFWLGVRDEGREQGGRRRRVVRKDILAGIHLGWPDGDGDVENNDVEEIVVFAEKTENRNDDDDDDAQAHGTDDAGGDHRAGVDAEPLG